MVQENNNPTISIIIPTLNEEANIGVCLDAVFSQNYEHLIEVIVSDNESVDNTRIICRKYSVRIVNGGKPAMARNNGAAAASGKSLLFLDADTLISKNFIESALKKYRDTNSGIASFFLKPSPETLFMKIVFTFYNRYGWCASRLNLPLFNTAGCCLLVDRSLHDAVGGFDEKMVVLEEYDYIRRIKRKSRFRVLPLKVTTSTRRFAAGQGIRKTFILLAYYFKWLFGKKITKDEYGYWN